MRGGFNDAHPFWGWILDSHKCVDDFVSRCSGYMICCFKTVTRYISGQTLCNMSIDRLVIEVKWFGRFATQIISPGETMDLRVYYGRVYDSREYYGKGMLRQQVLQQGISWQSIVWQGTYYSRAYYGRVYYGRVYYGISETETTHARR